MHTQCLLITASLLSLVPRLVHAQTTRKDPGVAVLWSVVQSGAGQVYAGETRKGLALMFGTPIAVLVGAKLSGATCREEVQMTTDPFGNPYVDSLASCRDNPTPFYVGSVVAVGMWLYSIFDAAPAAKRYNRRHGLAQRVTPVVGSGAMGATRAGLRVAF